ncbi:MAG TPA: hypothetical protein PKH79_15590 [Prolixibacteraceae bacterium]|nr:hypothetical protein [Prolixibacteraceae bacterium]
MKNNFKRIASVKLVAELVEAIEAVEVRLLSLSKEKSWRSC